MTPSALNSPSGQNFSPTVTPCNSPEGGNSPTRCLSPEPSIKNKNAFMNLEKKALRSVKLLERVENLGVENIVTASCRLSAAVSPLALYSSNIYTSRSSPMAQLTSLRNFTEKRNSDDNLKSRASSIDKKLTDPNKYPERKMSRIYRQKSRRSLKAPLTNGHSGQRQDLGTVRSTDLGKMEKPKTEEKSLVEGFVGSISSMFFGRKGGLL